MNIEIFQRPIVWENREENFSAIRSELEASPPDKGSLLVLAEMFSTGFTLNVKDLGEPADGPSALFLKAMAVQFEVCVVGSFPCRTPGRPKGLNRLLAYAPDGRELARYDKIHPFSYGKESDHYEGGHKLPLFRYAGWTVCPTVCYDLRFPELYRKATIEGGADLFLVIANWPSPRREHWKTLLKARAIENQAVVVGLNRVGEDPNCQYSGDSAVIDAQGQILLSLEDRTEKATVAVDREALAEWRTRFPALADATEAFEVIQAQ